MLLLLRLVSRVRTDDEHGQLTFGERRAADRRALSTQTTLARMTRTKCPTGASLFPEATSRLWCTPVADAIATGAVGRTLVFMREHTAAHNRKQE